MYLQVDTRREAILSTACGSDKDNAGFAMDTSAWRADQPNLVATSTLSPGYHHVQKRQQPRLYLVLVSEDQKGTSNVYSSYLGSDSCVLLDVGQMVIPIPLIWYHAFTFKYMQWVPQQKSLSQSKNINLPYWRCQTLHSHHLYWKKETYLQVWVTGFEDLRQQSLSKVKAPDSWVQSDRSIGVQISELCIYLTWSHRLWLNLYCRTIESLDLYVFSIHPSLDLLI